MTTPILGITELSASQDTKYNTVNQAIRDLEAAHNDVLSITITGNRTLTAAEFNKNFLFKLTGTPAAFDLTCPANKRGAFVVDNATGVTVTIKSAGAGASVTLVTGARRTFCSDAVNILALAPVA